MAQLDSNERPSNWWCRSQKPLNMCVCVCAETAEYRLRLADVSCISFAPEIGSADLADKWFCIVYQSYAILCVWHIVACAQMFIHAARRMPNARHWIGTGDGAMGKLVKHNRYTNTLSHTSMSTWDVYAHLRYIYGGCPVPSRTDFPCASTCIVQW